MGKKQDKRNRKKPAKVVLSLAEFNEDAGLGGVDPELSSLPSAPKAAEDWEAEGGRPEYNARGYKERTSTFKDRTYDADADFDDRDWARKGPLAEREDANTFGTGGPDRDWGEMRRGQAPTDADDGAGGTNPERNWNDMRRGPVESSFDKNAEERDWGARKGPVEAEVSTVRVIDDDQWGSARKTPVTAEFPQQKPAQDWSTRKPVEAERTSTPAEADWSAPRKGPVESEFASQKKTEQDWSARKTPVTADLPKAVSEADWSDARKGPVEAEVVKTVVDSDWSDARKGGAVESEVRKSTSSRDWSNRRGPVDAEVESVVRGTRDVDFNDMRRGSKFRHLVEESTKEAGSDVGKEGEKVDMGKDKWRRDSSSGIGRQGSHELKVLERPASTGHDEASKERDWGAARRSQPVSATDRHRPLSARQNMKAEVDGKSDVTAGVEENETVDEWTTVRSINRRSTGSAGRSGLFRSNRPSRFSGKMGEGRTGVKDSSSRSPPIRPMLVGEHKNSNTAASTLTHVASAVSDS